MRKWLVNLTGLLTISSSALPLTGCTFNFYVSRVKDKVAANLAIQTSSVIKSLIASKELSADTKSTIDDSLTVAGESIIQNHSQSEQINNWGDFVNNWGFNKNITTKGFTEDNFIVPAGKGSLTSKVNSLKSTNQILGYLTYITALNVIDNNTLYGVLIGKGAIGKPIITSFLKELKNQSLPEPFGSLINNILNDYKGNLLTPITTLLTELIDGWNDVTDPNALKTYMEGWIDNTGTEPIPYSQWISNNQWTLDTQYYQNWTANDINLYHGGTYLNYIFKKIGVDNPGKISESQYLGTIISSAAIKSVIGGSDLMQELLKALQPYLDLLLSNPKYVLTLIIGLIPLIKQLIFQADDLTHGIKKLTLGNHYPSDKPNNSYNLKEVFSQLKQILQDKQQVKDLATNLLASPLLYDIKLSVLVANGPLPIALDELADKGYFNKADLINTIADFLTGSTFKPIFDDIYNMIEKLNDQYQGTDGINLNLEGLKNLLIADNTGLLVLLEQVADTIKDIITPTSLYADNDDEITDEQLGKLYQSIGGQLPVAGGSAPSNFIEGSIIWTLRNELADHNSDLSNLVKIITRDDQYQGVANIITQQNETWIKENYTNYLLPSYPQSSIRNIDYKTSENSTQKIINIAYDFYYQVQGIKYHFLIKGIVVDNKANFLGTHNFKFTDIYLI